MHKEPERTHLRPLRAKATSLLPPWHLAARAARLSPLFALGGTGGALGGQTLAGGIALGEVVGAPFAAPVGRVGAGAADAEPLAGSWPRADRGPPLRESVGAFCETALAEPVRAFLETPAAGSVAIPRGTEEAGSEAEPEAPPSISAKGALSFGVGLAEEFLQEVHDSRKQVVAFLLREVAQRQRQLALIRLVAAGRSAQGLHGSSGDVDGAPR